MRTRVWNIVLNGSPEEVTAFQDELRDWYSEVAAASKSKPNLTSGDDPEDVAF